MATEGTGAAYAARDLGQGWKISPVRRSSEPGETFELAEHRRAGRDPADLDDACAATGAISILRIYWDDQEQPSVECPVGDFFAMGWEHVRAALVAGRLRQPGPRLQLLLGDALPQARAHHDDEHRPTELLASTTRSTTR